jgi:hypothetical protein
MSLVSVIIGLIVAVIVYLIAAALGLPYVVVVIATLLAFLAVALRGDDYIIR